jgi:acid stress chaperone HdeA
MRRKETGMAFRRVALGVIAIALMAGAGWVAGAGSSAAHKPLGKITCEDFLAVDDSFKPKLVYFGVAYAKGGKPEAAVLDMEGTEKITPMLIEACQAQPKASFWQKLKAEVKKIRQKL